jgi:hypothetical protein
MADVRVFVNTSVVDSEGYPPIAEIPELSEGGGLAIG